MSQFLKDEANRRLRSAQDLEEVASSTPIEEDLTEAMESEVPADGIITTEEEIAAFNIIRAIGCAEVPATDIHIRDAKTYCSILYLDNNRKAIVRLHFDRKIPRITIPGANEASHDLSSVEDIFQHSDAIRARLRELRDAE